MTVSGYGALPSAGSSGTLTHAALAFNTHLMGISDNLDFVSGHEIVQRAVLCVGNNSFSLWLLVNENLGRDVGVLLARPVGRPN